VKVFHDYLEYCETFSKYKTIDCENIKAIFNKYSKQNTSNVINKNCKFESAFEEEVYNQLAKKIDGERYDIITQFKDGSYRIDLVIYDKINKKHILAIECDGHTYHHLFLAQEKRDYYRQKYLEDRG
jgi:very-short-patch-repair endonuclease